MNIEALPAAGRTSSMYSKALATDFRALPADDGMLSEDIKASPMGNESLLAGNEALPTDNGAAPMVNEMLPMDNKTRDSCNATPPGPFDIVVATRA